MHGKGLAVTLYGRRRRTDPLAWPPTGSIGPARPALGERPQIAQSRRPRSKPKGPSFGRFRLTDRPIGEASRARFAPLVGGMRPYAGHSPVSVGDEEAFGLVEDDQYVAERIADAGAAANGDVERALGSLAAGVEE
jgi:hypothetical protein